MKLGDGDWFGDRWELTAPESYALLYGQKGEGTEIFKLALLELVARKLLTLVDAGEDYYLFETGSVALLKPGPEKEHPRSRSLKAVLDLLDGLPIHTTRSGETGILVTELARVARPVAQPPNLRGVGDQRKSVRPARKRVYGANHQSGSIINRESSKKLDGPKD